MTHRETLLEEAIRLTSGERNEAYGPPYDNLTYMADLVSAYLSGKYQQILGLDAEDMAWIMVMGKIARTSASLKDDNYVDAAAYSAIAGECRAIIDKMKGKTA